MDQRRYAIPIPTGAALPSRRDIVRGLVGVGLAVGAARRPGLAAEHTKREKPGLNAFGCVDVGKPCRGNDGLCCSGVCKGKKPKKGKRDASRCVAHGADICQAGQTVQDVCGGEADVACTTSTGANGACYTTTGVAPYCAREAYCHACSRDADCRPFCGKDAACVTCAGCTMTGGAACASPTIGLCGFPG